MNEDAIFAEALELEPQQRSAYLHEACGDDADLRARVESLLLAANNPDSFLEAGAAGIAPTCDVRPLSEKPGTMIGPYKLLQKIGEGGFGVVYMAEQIEPVRRKVALKIIKPGMDTREVVARFEAERQALALMDHPNIARVFDGGATDSGRPYFVMELVKGVPLIQFCDENKLATKERMEMFTTICRAIQHAHHKGIIHRDIKPNNVMVTLHDGKPVPKVIDFGVSKAISQHLTEKTLFTAYGQMIGTPQYMSPEQAEMSGLDIDTRSDVYSLGVLLYELLTGSTPLDAEQLRSTAYAEMQRLIREQEPPKPSTRLSTLGEASASVASQRGTDPKKLGALLRGDLDWIVMKSLDKNRERRYDSANAFAADVERFLNHEAVDACPPSLGYKFRAYVRRNKQALIVAGTIQGLLFLGICVSVVLAVRMLNERDRANLAEQLARDRLLKVEQEQNKTRIALVNAKRARDSAAKAKDNEIERREEAQQQRKEAEKQTRIANARRLAARSRETLLEHPQRSLMLAVEAIETSRRHGETHVPVAEQTLRDALASVGGTPVAGRYFAMTQRWLVTRDERRTILYDLKAGDPGGNPIYLKDHRALGAGGDGSLLVTLENDKTVYLWDLSVDKPASRIVYSGRIEKADSAVISPNHRWLVLGAKQSSYIWDLHSEKLVSSVPRILDGHLPRAIDAKSRWLVTTKNGLSAHVWSFSDTQSAALPSLLDPGGKMGQIVSVVISPDGRWLVIGGSDKRDSRVWDLNAEDPFNVKHILFGGFNERNGLELFSPNSRWLVSPGFGQIKVWDMSADDPVAASKTLHINHRYAADSVAFSSFDNVLVVGRRICNLTAEDLNKDPITLEGPHTCVALSSDKHWSAYGGSDKVIRLWDQTRIALDPSTLRANPMLLRGHEAEITTVRFSRNNRYLVSAAADGSTRIWDMTSSIKGVSPCVLRSQRARGLSPDGRWLLTNSLVDVHKGNGKGTRLWDLTSKNPGASSLALRGHSGELVEYAFSPNNRWLVTAGREQSVRLWDLRSADPSKSTITLLPGDDAKVSERIAPLLRCSFSAKGRWLMVSGPDLAARVWDLANENRHQPHFVMPARNNSIPAIMKVSTDDRWMVTTGRREITSIAGRAVSARLWDLKNEHPAANPIDLDGHYGGVEFAEFSADGRWLISAGRQSYMLLVWNLDEMKPGAAPMKLDAGAGMIRRLKFSPDKLRLAARSSDNAICLWDFREGVPEKPSAVLRGQQDDVEFQTILFSPDNRWLVADSPNKVAAYLWDLNEAQPVAPLIHSWKGNPSNRSSSFSPDSRWMLNWEYIRKRLYLTDLSGEDLSTTPPIELQDFRKTGANDGFTSIVFGPKSRYLATFDSGANARLWDLNTDKLSSTPIILTGSLTRHASGVDSRHNYGVRNAPFSGDGRWLVTRYYAENNLPHTALWNLQLSELIELARRTAGRELSQEERQLYRIPDK